MSIQKCRKVVFIGLVTEDWTDHTELVHIHFWQDKKGIITGCYEAEPRYFDNAHKGVKPFLNYIDCKLTFGRCN